MSLTDIFLFRWIRNLFSPARLRTIRTLVALMKPYAETLTKIDWDGDGVVDRKRVDLISLIGTIPARIAADIFEDYFDEEKRLRLETIRDLSVGSVKRALVIAHAVSTLFERAQLLPARGLFETAVQYAYEAVMKKKGAK